MRTLLAVVLHSLHQVALSVWLGGIVVVGAVAAPAVFRTARSQGHTDMSDPLYRFAGEAMGEVFRRFNYVVLAGALLLLVSGVAYGLLSGRCPRRVTVRAMVTALAGGVALWVSQTLYPELVRLRASGDAASFDQIHRTYSAAFQAQLVLLVGVAVLTAWMHLDRRSGGDSS